MSTGQPNKTQADMNRHNNEYLETLRLQAKINQQNLEVNRTYQETGTLPPSTQMMDTRSNAEKLQDTEKLKASIVLAMAPIAEPQFATAVVQKVLASPLNVGGMLMRWLAQNVDNMVQVLKKKYSIGIAGDDTDVEILVQFIEKSFTEMRQSMSSFSDYVKSTTGTNSQSKILTPQDIGTIIQQLQNIVGQLRAKQVNSRFLQQAEQVIKDLTFIGKCIPTQDVLNELVSIINNNNSTFTNDDNQDLYEAYKLLEKLPKMYVIQSLVDKMKRELENNNEKYATDSLNSIINQIKQLTTPEAKQILTIFEKKFLNRANDLETKKRGQENRLYRQEIKDMNEMERNQANAQKVYVINPQDDPVWVNGINAPPSMPPSMPPSTRQPTFAIEARLARIKQIVDKLNDNQFLDILDKLGQPEITTKLDLINYLANKDDYNIGDLGINGLGIGKRRRGRPKGGSIAVAPKPPAYIGFGVNQVNQDKLKDGYFKIRRGSKGPYNDLPMRKISPKLTSIFQTIVGGGIPKYNEVSSLDDEEKDYLHKIISVSKLDDKLSIPAPSKDKAEKDIHQFEVMKGEIMAGNDNADLVKKFKLLIVKLSKQGLLPKTQVNEVLEDLIMLGY